MGLTYVVAVSGGIDSVALLDMLAQTDHKLIVAHFDHGIRRESSQDAEFVRTLADKYGAEFVVGRGRLGRRASEEAARDRRYAFLRKVAAAKGGRIVTAHHGDDVIESIVANIGRGTGWRGLAVMGATDIARPLIAMTKTELIDYARQRGLEWRDDPSNDDLKYTRNRIRHGVVPKMTAAHRDELARFRTAQTGLRNAIDEEAGKLAQALGETRGATAYYQRHFFIMADELAAAEVLRAVLKRETGTSLTRPALHRLLLAIKTGRAGSKHHAGAKVTLVLGATDFHF